MVSASAVAQKYARALFDQSLVEGTLERVAADLHSLGGLGESTPELGDFLGSPEVLTEQKRDLVTSVLGTRVQPLVLHFLHLLIDKSRVNYLPEMCEAFRDLVDEHEGVLHSRVVTAVPLGADQERRLKAELDRITGKRVVIETAVEPLILGGVIVHLGNKIIDRSLLRGLRDISESLLHTEVG